MPMPLYVDLDGTLIRGDTMQQASLQLLRRRPLLAIRAIWLMATSGRVRGKQIVAQHVDLDARYLPYRLPVIEYIQAARAQGRRVVLATGSPQKFADAVFAANPGLLDAAQGTGNEINLIGPNKLEFMRRDAAGQSFEYLGDSHADVTIFNASAVAGWVGMKKLNFAATETTRLHRLCEERNDRPADLLGLMRPPLFLLGTGFALLPLFSAHSSHQIASCFVGTIAACAALGFLLVLYDLFHIDAHQACQRSRTRPIASGRVTVKAAVALALVLLIVGICLGKLSLVLWKHGTDSLRAGPITTVSQATLSPL